MEKQTTELRAYFFNNMYLQGIHSGVQSQHCTAEMFLKYLVETPSRTLLAQEDLLIEWANNHKTTIVLNGGMSGHLDELVTLLSSEHNPYPWAFFKESEFALEGALTNVGIILPDIIFKAPFVSEEFDGGEEFEQYRFENNLTEWEVEFIKVLKSKRLAN